MIEDIHRHSSEQDPSVKAPEIPESLRRGIAKNRIDEAVEESVGGTVATIRYKVGRLQEQEPDGSMDVYDEYLRKLGVHAAGHDGVQIENLGRGIKGVNKHVGTHNTAIDADQMTAEQILSDGEETEQTLDHENSETMGHAGQKEIQGVVGRDGEFVDAVTILEGNVEQETAKKYGKRKDMPAETYGEGYDFAQDVGVSRVNQYARIDGDRLDFQAHILRQSGMDADQMRGKLEHHYKTTEVDEIIHRVRGKFEHGPEKKAA